MLRKAEEGKFSYYRLNVPRPNPQLRSSDPEGGSYWDEEMPFRLGRNSNVSMLESHPRHPRVSQPMNRPIRRNLVKISRYQKVFFS
jgi:hypothetical protein